MRSDLVAFTIYYYADTGIIYHYLSSRNYPHSSFSILDRLDLFFAWTMGYSLSATHLFNRIIIILNHHF